MGLTPLRSDVSRVGPSPAFTSNFQRSFCSIHLHPFLTVIERVEIRANQYVVGQRGTE
jgi:hypothetical protein